MFENELFTVVKQDKRSNYAHKKNHSINKLIIGQKIHEFDGLNLYLILSCQNVVP